MIIGIDDTDSRNGMCTTYLLAVIIEMLERYGTLKGYPLLVRLNPNIKYKTRGNAALAIIFEPENGIDSGEIKALVIETVEEMAVLSDENTNPGVVFIESSDEELCADLRVFSMQAVQDILEIKQAEELMKRHGISYRGFKNCRGLIGALAASGFALFGLPDYTFELIAYREKNRWGTPREIDEDSVWMAADTPDTWDTVDNDNRTIVFAPHSPDPILFGIRGGSEEAVRHAFSKIRSEPVERHVVYLTNQNTDMHLIKGKIGDVHDMCSYILEGIVAGTPRTIEGGHVIFKISDNGVSLDCAAFEPTKGFRSVIRKLREGDAVTVFGSVNEMTLNLEKIQIRSLNKHAVRNPLCCNKRMKSLGKGQGFRCVKCGDVKREQEIETVNRDIETGFYEVPPCARRHLSKPLARYR